MKILIIEDELSIVHFLTRGLKDEGYEVKHTDEGEEAFKLMEKSHFDLIILDLILPGMSGEDFLKRLREQKDSTPVIVLTSVDDAEIKTRLLNAGADDYMVKPFSLVELYARVHSVLRRTGEYQKKSETLVVGDLKMNPEMHQVTRAGKVIKLRLKEYVLLAYLMQNKNKVISRSTLIEQVWDYNAQLFSNTVDSHMCKLRNKLNKGYNQKLIETVHGVGYILRSPETKKD